MQRIQLEPIYILHTRPFSNTSLIIDCISEKHGRLSLIARSARGLKSRYKGLLQLFAPLLVSWTGNRELKNLGNVELCSAIFQLKGQALICGFYLNELLQRLLQREDPHPDIFELYETTLTQLQNNNDPRPALRYFEKNLLQSLGYGLPLQNDAQTHQQIHADMHYQYVPERGFIQCHSESNNHFIFSGKTLLSLAHNQLDDESVLQESKRLLRLVLNRHLGSKPIKSRELLK